MKLSFKDALVSHSPEGESKNPTKPQNGLLYKTSPASAVLRLSKYTANKSKVHLKNFFIRSVMLLSSKENAAAKSGVTQKAFSKT